MFRIIKITAVLVALLFCVFMAKETLAAEEIVSGMKQGDFAMLLVKELGAEGLLPPAATTLDAIKFLEKLGIMPQDGWDEEAIVDTSVLEELVGIKEDEAGQFAFDELLTQLEDKIENALASMGLRTVPSQTISPSGAL